MYGQNQEKYIKNQKNGTERKEIKYASIPSQSTQINSLASCGTLSNRHSPRLVGRASVEAGPDHAGFETELTLVKVAGNEVTHVTLGEITLDIALIDIAEYSLGYLPDALGNALGGNLALLKVALLDLSLVEESGNELLLVEMAGDEFINVTLIQILNITEEELQSSLSDLADALGDTLRGNFALLEIPLLNLRVIEVPSSELFKVTLVKLFQVALIEFLEITEEELQCSLSDLANALGDTLGSDLALFKVALLKLIEITLIKFLKVTFLEFFNVTEEQFQGALGDLANPFGNTLSSDLTLLKVTLIKLGLVIVSGSKLLLVEVALNELFEVSLIEFIHITLFDVTEEDPQSPLGNLANALGDTLGGDLALLEVTSNKLLLVIVASDELLEFSLAEFINVTLLDVTEQDVQGTLGNLAETLCNALGGDLALLEISLLGLGLGLGGESNAHLATLVGLLGGGSSAGGVLTGLVVLSRLGNLLVGGESNTELAALASLVGGSNLGELLVGRKGDAHLPGGSFGSLH
ncbi:unnamed protein product [Clonostachys rosea]|uniref:Uncharacterized protein n=1 Tax=Bionectria ochroleuca TaxID=29856 RepID=A0ABY6V183_BIOOC|nr:unnamed protein product [Clonostachys rosea]